MKRWLATVRCDVEVQRRNGFWTATLVVTLVWLALLTAVPRATLVWLLPPMVLGNLLLGTYFFVGGLVLLERNEATPLAQSVTPLRIGEYLAAKLVTHSTLALAETVVLVVAVAGTSFSLGPLVAGVLLAAILYCLAGCIAVARFGSLNEYLLPAGAVAGLLWVPLLAYLARWSHWLLLLHPLSAPLVLVEAAFAPRPAPDLLFGLVMGAGWVVVLALWSRRALQASRSGLRGAA